MLLNYDEFAKMTLAERVQTFEAPSASHGTTRRQVAQVGASVVIFLVGLNVMDIILQFFWFRIRLYGNDKSDCVS